MQSYLNMAKVNGYGVTEKSKARIGPGNFSSGKVSKERCEGVYIGYMTEQIDDASAAWRKIYRPKSWRLWRRGPTCSHPEHSS